MHCGKSWSLPWFAPGFDRRTCSEGSRQIITLSFMRTNAHTNILVNTCTCSHMPALTHTLFECRLCVAILPGPCLHAKLCHGASLHSNPSAKDVNPSSRKVAWPGGVSEGAATEGEKESQSTGLFLFAWLVVFARHIKNMPIWGWKSTFTVVAIHGGWFIVIRKPLSNGLLTLWQPYCRVDDFCAPHISKQLVLWSKACVIHLFRTVKPFNLVNVLKNMKSFLLAQL